VRVDVEDAVHLRGHDDECVVKRYRAAREPGATAARNERALVPAGDADGTGHLVRGPGPADRDRAALAHARVACVQRELERLGARGVRTERRAQIGEERVV
jgi:hypothetical protein